MKVSLGDQTHDIDVSYDPDTLQYKAVGMGLQSIATSSDAAVATLCAQVKQNMATFNRVVRQPLPIGVSVAVAQAQANQANLGL